MNPTKYRLPGISFRENEKLNDLGKPSVRYITPAIKQDYEVLFMYIHVSIDMYTAVIIY
jgi:hypothetical protein